MEGHRRITENEFERAKVLCSEFLGGDWSNKDLIKATILTGGYANFIICCELIEEIKHQNNEPHKVIVRLMSGINPMRCLGEAGEALALKAVAEAGIGPKLIGVSEGARLEEFIECRFFNKEETRNANVLIAIGRCLGRQHSLDVALRKDPNVYKNCIRDFIVKGMNTIRASDTYKNLGKFEPKIREKLAVLLKLDYLEEFDWILEQLGKVKSRVICLSHGDHYLNNVLVKKSWLPDTPISEFDIVTIDVEMGSYFYRGLDIGLFLHELAFNFAEQTSAPEFLPPISDELERSFIENYLQNWIKLNPDKFDPDLDTFENVQLESRILCLFAGCYFPTYLLTEMSKGIEHVQFVLVDYMVKRRSIDMIKKNWIINKLKN